MFGTWVFGTLVLVFWDLFLDPTRFPFLRTDDLRTWICLVEQ